MVQSADQPPTSSQSTQFLQGHSDCDKVGPVTQVKPNLLKFGFSDRLSPCTELKECKSCLPLERIYLPGGGGGPSHTTPFELCVQPCLEPGFHFHELIKSHVCLSYIGCGSFPESLPTSKHLISSPPQFLPNLFR